MRFVEINKLSEFIESSREFVGQNDVYGIFSAIDTRAIVSLQGEALAADRDYLKELTSLLNVIVSIINHPHLANKGEEVILRVEQASALGNDEFRQVLRDSKLWKRHGAEMIPEEVHYRQQIDELRIYENRFITFLVDALDRELAGYSAFYLTKLPTMREGAEALDSGEVGDIILTVDRLRRKIQFIKNTQFYKVVSEGKALTGKIQPTNILTKDRLYRYCFKFYRSFIRYGDINELCAELRVYYVLTILKELKRLGFKIDKRAPGGDDVLRLRHAGIKVSVELCEDIAVRFTVQPRGQIPASHLLLFGAGGTKHPPVSYDPKEFDTVELISLWELYDVTRREDARYASEISLVREWIQSKITTVTLDRRIYEKYCPACGARGVEHDGEVYRCTSCHSEYSFIGGDDSEKVWFRKIRK
ncbi:MAG: DUF2357 domain-containing protein [Clostridia bacterium]|nr:DUF2357 domain-containing protein [Clostridia bacterium]